MSRPWEPNNGIRASIVERDLEAEIEGALKLVDNLFSFTSWPATSDKCCNFIPCAKDLLLPLLPLIITGFLGYLVEDSHFTSDDRVLVFFGEHVKY